MGIRKMRRKRSLYVDCSVVVLLIILLTAVNQGYIHRRAFISASDATTAAPKPASSPAAAPAMKTLVGYSNPALSPEPAAKGAPIPPVFFRPLNFALLRGGFTSVDEFFERVSEDPILHSFYGDCSDRNASMHPLNSDVLVFTAFRRDNQIKWAKRPLLVRKGEYVMTYCGKTVLARCANLISMAAMQPSEDIPPGLLETPVDAIQPPISYASGPIAELLAPAPAAVMPAPEAVTPVAAHQSRSYFFIPFIPPFYVPGHGHNPWPPATVTPPAASTPPASSPPPSAPPPSTPPPNTPPPTTPPSGPPSGPPSAPPSGPPGPPTHVSGDEFTDHGAAFTLLAIINLARIITIVVRAKETHYGLTNTSGLAVLILLVWKLKWLRLPDSALAATSEAL
jgi:hypothetical protein